MQRYTVGVAVPTVNRMPFGSGCSTHSRRTILVKEKHMNIGHKLGRLRNRLARLKKKTSEAGADRQGSMVARIKEIEEILRQSKS